MLLHEKFERNTVNLEIFCQVHLAPCMSAEYFLRPVTVHSIVPPCRKNSEHTRDSFRGRCPMIVPISQSQRIDRKRFRALFRTPRLSNPPLPIYTSLRKWYLEYNNCFRKTLP